MELTYRFCRYTVDICNNAQYVDLVFEQLCAVDEVGRGIIDNVAEIGEWFLVYEHQQR